MRYAILVLKRKSRRISTAQCSLKVTALTVGPRKQRYYQISTPKKKKTRYHQITTTNFHHFLILFFFVLRETKQIRSDNKLQKIEFFILIIQVFFWGIVAHNSIKKYFFHNGDKIAPTNIEKYYIYNIFTSNYK